MSNEIKTVPQALADLGGLYKERNALYKDNYLRFGEVMVGLFPNGITLNSVEDHNRFALLVHRITKETRYANSFAAGGHVDSLDDITVYAQMAQEHDAIQRRARETAFLKDRREHSSRRKAR